MTSFDDVVSKAKTVADAAGKKTSELIETAKLKLEVVDLEKEIRTTLEGLGRLVYDSKKSGQDVGTLVDESAANLDDQHERLRALIEKIDALRGQLRCARCGVNNPQDADYCKKCGAPLDGE